MNKINNTIEIINKSCDLLENININLLCGYQQLEQLLESIEKYFLLFCYFRGNIIAENWIKLFISVSKDSENHINRFNEINEITVNEINENNQITVNNEITENFEIKKYFIYLLLIVMRKEEE